MSLGPAALAGLEGTDLDAGETEVLVRRALEEDFRYGPDLTTAATVPAAAVGLAEVVARRPGIVAGVPLVACVLDAIGSTGWKVEVVRPDGSEVAAGELVAKVRAPLRDLLGAERTLLNFLTHLSGVATTTRAWVDAVAGTGCVVRDTRKTLPGLRQLQKYAVRCGGGANHRMGLGDACLIKDNHLLAAGGVAAAVTAVRASAPHLALEVECDTLEQVGEAVEAGVGLILLDNMDLGQLRASVALGAGHPVRFEASGGLSLAEVRAVATTGVDFVAIGALTHSSPALDLGLDLRASD